MQYFSLFFGTVAVTKFGKMFLKINTVEYIFNFDLGSRLYFISLSLLAKGNNNRSTSSFLLSTDILFLPLVMISAANNKGKYINA